MRDPLSRVQIKYKLTGAFVGICLFAFGVGGYLVSVSAGDALEDEISRRLEMEAHAYAQQLESQLELLGRRAEDFASDGFIRTRLLTLAQHDDPHDAGAVREELIRHLTSNKFPLVPTLSDLAVCSREGGMLASVRDEVNGLPQRVIIRGAAADTLWCSPFVRRDDAYPLHFALFAPVWDIDHRKRIGSVVFVLDARAWLTPLVTGSDGTTAIPFTEHNVTIEDGAGTRIVLHRGNDGGPLNGMDQGRTTAELLQKSPLGRLIHNRPIHDYGWDVRVAVDATKAMLPVSGLQSRFLGAGLIIAAVALILLFFPVRFLIRPLGALQQAARSMQQGDLSVRVDDSAEDEIGDLARSFNLMAEATEDRTRGLENTARLLERRSNELAIERDMLETIVRSMQDAVLYLDKKGTIVLHNNAAEPLRHALENGFSDLMPRVCGKNCSTAEECRICLENHAAEAPACVLEVGDRMFEIIASRIRSRGGPEGTLLVARDVTARMRIDERQAHQDRLAVLGEVSAVMAHELNNPLAAISMFSQLLHSDLPGESPLRENVDVILRNTENCKRTIQDLLNYSRQTRVETDDCDLHELIPDVIRFLRPLYERTDITIDFRTEAEDAVLNCDVVYLRQVFVNLCMNAVQAMEQSPGRLRIRVFQPEGDNGVIAIDVADEGNGIPEAMQEQIFEPFFTSKPSGKGTGLGLSISRRIVRSFDGTLTLLHSRPGDTVFRVQLPRKRRPAA